MDPVDDTSPAQDLAEINRDIATPSPPQLPTRLTIPHQQPQRLKQQDAANIHLTPSESTNTIMFRSNYDTLLKEVLEDDKSTVDDSMPSSVYGNQLHQYQQLHSIDIDLDAATADLPNELRAALEDRSLADKYLDNLKTFMSHQRSHSMGSMTSGKGDYSSPTTPLQPTFSIQSPTSAHPPSSSSYYRMQQDPLYKVLDAVPYQTRLINGVQSLWELQKKLTALKIPELDLPSVSDTVIKARLNDLYKVQDDLFIHLHGGPLVRNTHRLLIGEKKKREIDRLLDQVAKEIGLYEEFVKRDNYLSLESILNEPDSSDSDQDSENNDTVSTISHFGSPLNLSYKPIPIASPSVHSARDNGFGSSSSAKRDSSLRRVTSQPAIATMTSSTSTPTSNAHSNYTTRFLDSASTAGSVHSYDAVSDPSLSQLLASDEDSQDEKSGNVSSEAFKWTPLIKISDHLYSKDVRQTSGLVSALAVSGVIAVGTTRSLVFVYDYSQNLKCILGDSHRAIEVGAVTSLAISADHSTIACGHSQGHLVIWDIRKPQQAIRTIDPIEPNQSLGTSMTTSSASQTPSNYNATRKEGHVRGAAILHVGFVGVKRSEIVSADDQGMAFYHVLYKVMMVNAVDTTRILGRYQNLSVSSVPSSPSSSSSTTATNRPLHHGQPLSSLVEPGSGGTSSPRPRRPSTVFAMQLLPLGQLVHPAENFGLVALLTPYKMIIVGLKPSCQTQYKFLKPKIAMRNTMDASSPTASAAEEQPDQNQQKFEAYHENLSGCLGWLPVTKSNGSLLTSKHGGERLQKEMPVPSLEDPVLAFAWGNRLFILKVGVGMAETDRSPGRLRSPMGNKNKRGTRLHFPKPTECQLEDSIVALQWINRQILVLFTPNEEMLLFDPRKMAVTERVTIRDKQPVYHDWFHSPLRELAATTTTIGLTDASKIDMNATTTTTSKTVEMAYYHSLKGYKGKLFLLGLDQLFVGTLLSWADRILALVRTGDFLAAIKLATAFYNGKWIQTVIGLPADERQRKQLVGERLMELLVASLNYAFSSARRSLLPEDQQQEQRELEGHRTTTRSNDGDVAVQLLSNVAGPVDIVGNTVLFQDLAKCCVDACLSMGDRIFLFETAYERFAEHGVHGHFLQVLESYIVTDQLRDIPPAIMKDLVTHYSTHGKLASLERIIWHVQPQCLDIDQIVGVCQREGLYEAMMYVWNRSMDDFVSPLVEMLKVIRQALKKSDETTSKSKGQWDSSVSMIQQQQQQQQYGQAEKVFDYLKMVLQGRTFPEGAMMPSSRGNEARSAVYSFVFSGRCVVWPRIGGKLILTVDENEAAAEPTYPYLRLLLRFNTKRFLEALEVAFEDPWLNGGDDMLTSTFEEDVLQGKVISRQIIVNTLLDVMGGGGMTANGNSNGGTSNSLLLSTPRLHPSLSASTVQSGAGGTNKGSGASSDTASSYYDGDNNPASSQNDHLLQLYTFIANNLHKYTTFILLPLTTKQKILLRLTVGDIHHRHHHHHHHHRHDIDETRDERQRAVQRLLTVFTPNNEEAMTTLYEEAKFWNVLEDVYRRDKKYGKLVETYLKDTTSMTPTHRMLTPDQDCIDKADDEETALIARQQRVFDCVDWILDDTSPLSDHQRQDVKRVVLIRISQFVDMDGQRSADLVEKYFDANHHDILRRLDEDEEFEDDEEETTFENDNPDDPLSPSSRFPVTFARMADKRIFSYLRGLLEPQPPSSSVAEISTTASTVPATSLLLNGSNNNQHVNGTVPEEDEGFILLDEPLTKDDTTSTGDGNISNKKKLRKDEDATPTTITRTNIDAKLQERYIDLMCRFDPSGVYNYLNTKLYDYGLDSQQKHIPTLRHQSQEGSSGRPEEYVNFDNLLKSCEKYGVMDAVVWIMEKMGNVKGALEKMLEVGKEKIQMILLIIKQQENQQPWMLEDQGKISNGLIGLSGVLRVGIRLCENSSRNSNGGIVSGNDGASDSDDEIESLWFRLLDVYVEASMEVHSALAKNKHPHLSLPIGVQQHVIYTFKSFVHSILTSLLLSTSPQVSLPRLLLRLIDSQTKGETTFADFRDIFLSMLDTYKYEGQLLALTNRLFDRDLFLGVQDMVHKRGKGWRPQAMICSICSTGILDMSLMQPSLWKEEPRMSENETGDIGGQDPTEDDKILVFHCGHAYHRPCLSSQLNDETRHLHCILCDAPPLSTSGSTKITVDKGKSKANIVV